MQTADLAQRLAALDLSGTSLEHRLTISAAVETLKVLAEPPRSNVVALPLARPRTRWTTLCHMDGREWASSCHFGAEGAWGWVLETVAAEHGVSEDAISSAESDETQPYDCDDLVTVDGLPVYRLRHTSK